MNLETIVQQLEVLTVAATNTLAKEGIELQPTKLNEGIQELKDIGAYLNLDTLGINNLKVAVELKAPYINYLYFYQGTLTKVASLVGLASLLSMDDLEALKQAIEQDNNIVITVGLKRDSITNSVKATIHEGVNIQHTPYFQRVVEDTQKPLEDEKTPVFTGIDPSITKAPLNMDLKGVTDPEILNYKPRTRVKDTAPRIGLADLGKLSKDN